jgi:hypothetical protein
MPKVIITLVSKGKLANIRAILNIKLKLVLFLLIQL